MGSETAMMVEFWRRGGRVAPPDREYLAVDDQGNFRLWRSVNVPVVGQFVGLLSTTEQTRLQAEVAAANQTGSIRLVPLPDSAIETVTIGSVQASLGHTDQPDGAWGTLISHLRQLMDQLTNAPQAALALEVDGQGRSARIIHRGPDAVKGDLHSVMIRAVLWGGYYEMMGNWHTTQAGASSPLMMTPGWSLDLVFDHGFTLEKGQVIHTYVRFDLYDGAGIVPVSLVHAPLITPPL